MTLIELLDKLIAGQPVTPAEAQAVKDGLNTTTSIGAGIDRDTNRLRNAANRLREQD